MAEENREEPLNIQFNFARFGKRLAMVATLGALCFLAAVPRAHADDRDRDRDRDRERAKCQERIEKAEHKLDEAIRKHGEYSHQARDRRRDLSEQREHCWSEFHSYWNGHDHAWHNEHDWDRDDHDRDKDRDRDHGDHFRDRNYDYGSH